MAGTILTPTAIWKDFEITFDPSAEVIDTLKTEKATFSKLYIQGQAGGSEFTKIYCTLARPEKRGKLPAILLLQDLEYGYDEKLVSKLVEEGFVVLSVDLAGCCEEEFFTLYPEALSYANYSVAKDVLERVDDGVLKTCWYEWARVTRYALKYLTNQTFVSKVGGFALGEVATVLWQVSGTCKELSCSAFALNAGWRAYRQISKFGGDVEPQFSDNKYKFIAGIEPQTYAMHVDCPVLMLSPTNSNEYDCDRASDTVSRIASNVFKAVHYSVGYRNRVSGQAFKNACIFFEEFLKRENSAFRCTSDISCEIADGKLEVLVSCQGEVKKVELYASEGEAEPSKRCWQQVCGGVKKEDGSYAFIYQPYQKSAHATFFALITYKNGFVAGTKIINKKFAEDEVLNSYKSKILYSSRVCGAESVFNAANQDQVNHVRINLSDKKRVNVKKGPMGIEGVGSEWGLSTFKISSERDMPNNDAILMFDVYSKVAGEIQVKLIADYFGTHTVYTERVKLLGGDVWQNVKIALNRYKTAEGMGLKSYEKIEAVEFSAQDEFLINNALWV